MSPSKGRKGGSGGSRPQGRRGNDVRTVTEWETVTRRYRRGLGGWWWLGLLLIPALLGLIGLAFGDDDPVDVAAPTTPSASVMASATSDAAPTSEAAPSPSATDEASASETESAVVPSDTESETTTAEPSASSPSTPEAAAPFSVVRAGDEITVTAEVADDAAKAALIKSVQDQAGAGVKIVDKVTVKAGAAGPGDGLADVVKAAGTGDVSIVSDGKALTLTGPVASEDAKKAAGDAAGKAWPDATIDNQLTVKAAEPAAAEPFSVVRAGNDVTVTAVVADEAAKAALIKSVQDQVGTEVKVTDKITMKAGAADPTAGIAASLKAAEAPGDVSVVSDGKTVTLTGEVPSDAAKSAAEATASKAWPGVKVDNQLTVKATAEPAGSCGTLGTDINALLKKTPIVFATDGLTLPNSSKRVINGVAKMLKACPDAKVEVGGHTDNTGNDGINKPLSAGRAKTVADQLVTYGAAKGNVTSKGYGSSKPIGNNNSDAGRQANRRVEITVK